MATRTNIKVAMTPPHPGAFFKEEVLEPLDLSVTGAAGLLHVHRATLSDFVNAKTSLSAEMARRIELVFGLDMEQMLKLQAWHDTARLRRTTSAETLAVKPYRSAPE